MNLYEKMNLKEIIFSMYIRDVMGLMSSQDVKLSEDDKKDLLSLAQTDNLKSVNEGLSNFFNKLAEQENYDLAVMISLFLQRYHYLQNTEDQFKKYSDKFEDIDYSDPATFFTTYISDFFFEQMNIYVRSYRDILVDFKIEEISSSLFNQLNNFINSIESENDFTTKLQNTEEFVRYLQDTKNIFMLLESTGDEGLKQIFLTHTNEVKIVFQTMNALISAILAKIVEIVGEI